MISGLTRYELDDCINTVEPKKWVPFPGFPCLTLRPGKTSHETRSHEQRQVPRRSRLRSETFPPPPVKQLFPSFFKKRLPLTFFPLQTGTPAMSTCHTVYFNKTGFSLPHFPLLLHCIVIHASKRHWTEFSLSKMSRFVSVIREHSWSTPAALWLIQMEQVTCT